MEAIIHIIGVCSDTHSHYDLMDAIMYGSGSMVMIHYCRDSIKMWWTNIRRILK